MPSSDPLSGASDLRLAPVEALTGWFARDSRLTPVNRLNLLRADQRRRWTAGQPVRVETYLQLLPTLREDTEAQLDLICQEFQLRVEQGQSPLIEEYRQRFPLLAGPLARWLELQALMLEGPVDPSNEPTYLHPNHANGERPVVTLTGAAPAGGAGASVTVPGIEILDEIGRGAAGVVYRALQPGIGRTVALKKILHGHVAGSEEMLRFLAEAAIISRLQHPNIVQLYEFGTHGGQPYFALEYVPGGSLSKYLAGDPKEPREAARLLVQVADGVEAAHQAGVIHRDLKPGNILLAEDASPKITDFGLAKQREGSDLTLTGAVMGTPGYMAPEQAAGKARQVGAEADIYALGAILYEALTGRPPLKGATMLETLQMVREADPVPPRLLQPGVPRDLETVCLKCLEKDPARRYRTARALADDLRRFLNGEAIHARPVSTAERAVRWCHRHPAPVALFTVIALALGGLVALGIWFSGRLGEARGKIAAAEAEVRAEQAESARARERSATHEFFRLIDRMRQRRAEPELGWTAENRQALARASDLVLDGTDTVDLRTEAAAALTGVDLQLQRKLAHGFVASAMAFHPDGRHLVLGQFKAQAWAVCSVLLVDWHTGETKRRLNYCPSLTWQGKRGVQDGCTTLGLSADGSVLVVGTRSGMLHRWDLKSDRSTPESWQGHECEVDRVVLLPDDGGTLSAGPDGVKRWGATPTRGPEATLPTPSRQGLDLALLPDRRHVLLADRYSVRRLDVSRLRPTEDVLDIPARCLAVSPDGRWLLLSQANDLQLVDVARHTPVATFRYPLKEHAQDTTITDLVLSPDGTLAATAARETKHLTLWDVASGRLLLDVNVGNGFVAPVFCPHGKMLAVAHKDEIAVYAVTGRDVLSTVAPHPDSVVSMSWSPEGDTLACLQWPDTLTFWQTGGRMAAECLGPLPGVRRDLGSALAFHPSGSYLAVATGHGVELVGRDSMSSPTRLPASLLEQMTFGPEGRLWTSSAETVSAWDPDDGRRVAHWSNGLSQRVTGLGTIHGTAVGRRNVVAAGRDGLVYLLRPDNGSYVGAWSVSRGRVRCVALNADESLALVGTWRGEFCLLRLADGKLLSRLPAHRDTIEAVAFVGPELVATGSRDRTVRLWHLQGEALRELMSLRVPGPVRSLAMRPDGKTLAMLLDGERAVRLWDLDRLRDGLGEFGLDLPGFLLD